jgi:hypothetical protein
MLRSGRFAATTQARRNELPAIAGYALALPIDVDGSYPQWEGFDLLTKLRSRNSLASRVSRSISRVWSILPALARDRECDCAVDAVIGERAVPAQLGQDRAVDVPLNAMTCDYLNAELPDGAPSRRSPARAAHRNRARRTVHRSDRFDRFRRYILGEWADEFCVAVPRNQAPYSASKSSGVQRVVGVAPKPRKPPSSNSQGGRSTTTSRTRIKRRPSTKRRRRHELVTHALNPAACVCVRSRD